MAKWKEVQGFWRAFARSAQAVRRDDDDDDDDDGHTRSDVVPTSRYRAEVPRCCRYHGVIVSRMTLHLISPSLGLGRRAFAEASTFLERGEVQERTLNVLRNFPKIDPMKVSADAHFTNDLGLDSLDQVEVVMAFEEEFAIQIPDDEAEKILSTDDAIRYISSHPQAK